MGKDNRKIADVPIQYKALTDEAVFEIGHAAKKVWLVVEEVMADCFTVETEELIITVKKKEI